ncbi:MAG TPA: SprT-like domain-containing protein, partial [Nocardioides sp.]|nr:SprT-like domain-containing protein [Nocardioides sp.]
MDLRDAFALAEYLLEVHGLDDWDVAYDNAKRRAGVCRFADKTLGLSAPLTAVHSDDDVRDTILHEIAHALVGPQHGHDATWVAKARAIGSSGERCVSPDAPAAPAAW